MNYEIELPDLGPAGGDHGTVVQWRFEEGEYVEEGEILLEVAGEKDSAEIPSPRSGILIERIVEEDEVVRVGEPIALLETTDTESEGEDEDSE